MSDGPTTQALIEFLERQASECRSDAADFTADSESGRWFLREATNFLAAADALRSLPKASSTCPLCGADTPHRHTQEFIADWLRAQGQTYHFTGRVLPPFNDSAVLADLREFCDDHPYAYGEHYALIFRARDLLEALESRGEVAPSGSLLAELREIQQDARRSAGHIDHIAVAWGRFIGFIEKTVRAFKAAPEADALRSLPPEALAHRFFACVGIEFDLDNALMIAMGATADADGETDPESWPCRHIVYDYYDGSFELWNVKADDWQPAPAHLASAWALGFARGWICYPDGTERYYSSKGEKSDRKRSPLPRQSDEKYRLAKLTVRAEAAEAEVACLTQARDTLHHALTRIRDSADPAKHCHCDHRDENCCERVGEYCPECIAALVLTRAAEGAQEDK